MIKTICFQLSKASYETDEQLKNIIHDEKRNPHLFELAQGVAFRCHLVYYKQISSNDLLTHKDVLIFNFHHGLFDFPSMDVFLHDLNQAYTTSQLSIDDNTTLRYLDCNYQYTILYLSSIMYSIILVLISDAYH